MKQFINEKHEVDRESLRRYVLEELNTLGDGFEAVVQDTKNESFWSGVHTYIATQIEEKRRNDYFGVIRQIRFLPQYIDGWIHIAVDSPERMEFFILSKAAELRSGSQDNDYYWAMQIRHDQLVALVNVLKKLQDHLSRWLKLSPKKLIEEPVFEGLLEWSIEKQVYLEAERLYKERSKQE